MKPGIYDISSEMYHADQLLCEVPSLSASIASVIVNRSPAHAREKHPRLNPDFEPEQKDVFDLGSAAHNMVLRQDCWREEIEVVNASDWRTKAAKEARNEARAAGRHPVLADQFVALNKMVGVLEGHPHAGKAFTNGKPEQTLIWQDEETGAMCRCRPDWTPDDFKVWPDYKTTADARPDVWDRRFIMDHGGLMRAAWYEEGVRRVTGEKAPFLYYVVQEVTPPYPVVVRVVPSNSNLLDIGRRMMRQALRTWAECLERNEWPAYEFLGSLSVPEWTEKKLDMETAA